MSPKIHPDIHNVGRPGSTAKPIPVEKPSVRPDPNVSTIPGPVPSTPRHDPSTSPSKVSIGTTPDDNFMVVNKPK